MAMIDQRLVDYAATVVQSGLFDLFLDAKVQNLGQQLAGIPHTDIEAVAKAHRELHYFVEFGQFINELVNDEQIAAYLQAQEEQRESNVVVN